MVAPATWATLGEILFIAESTYVASRSRSLLRPSASEASALTRSRSRSEISPPFDLSLAARTASTFFSLRPLPCRFSFVKESLLPTSAIILQSARLSCIIWVSSGKWSPYHSDALVAVTLRNLSVSSSAWIAWTRWRSGLEEASLMAASAAAIVVLRSSSMASASLDARPESLIRAIFIVSRSAFSSGEVRPASSPSLWTSSTSDCSETFSACAPNPLALSVSSFTEAEPATARPSETRMYPASVL